MRIDLPGWDTKINEISNGVFKVMLTDKFGRTAEVVDGATEETIDKAIEYAFDIQKQITKNWNKFLYDLFLLRIEKNEIIKQEYNEQAFGSWFIEFRNKRIVYDGRDYWLLIQTRNIEQWLPETTIKNADLTFGIIKKVLMK